MSIVKIGRIRGKGPCMGMSLPLIVNYGQGSILLCGCLVAVASPSLLVTVSFTLTSQDILILVVLRPFSLFSVYFHNLQDVCCGSFSLLVAVLTLLIIYSNLWCFTKLQHKCFFSCCVIPVYLGKFLSQPLNKIHTQQK